jgi:NitT/TauT family transport system permease protein
MRQPPNPLQWLANAVIVSLMWALGLVATSVKEGAQRGFFGSLQPTFEEAGAFLVSWELWSAIGSTLYSFVITFAASILCGTLLALLIHFVWWAWILETAIRFLRPIPAIAMIAIGVILLSTASPRLGMFVAFAGGLWPYTVAALDAFRRVPKSMEESAITLGKTRRQYIFEVLFPASLPSLFAAVRLVAPIVLLLTVTTEYIYQNLGGLGALLADKQYGVAYPLVLSTVLVLGVLGWLAETLVEWVEVRTLSWKHTGPTEH